MLKWKRSDFLGRRYVVLFTERLLSIQLKRMGKLKWQVLRFAWEKQQKQLKISIASLGEILAGTLHCFPSSFSRMVQDLALRQKHLGTEGPKCFLSTVTSAPRFLLHTHVRSLIITWVVGPRCYLLYLVFPQFSPGFSRFSTRHRYGLTMGSMQASTVCEYLEPIFHKSFREF